MDGFKSVYKRYMVHIVLSVVFSKICFTETELVAYNNELTHFKCVVRFSKDRFSQEMLPGDNSLWLHRALDAINADLCVSETTTLYTVSCV